MESPRVIVWDRCIYSLPDVSRFLNIVSQHLPSAHGYADDAGSVIKKCIAYVRSWFIGNRLMINDSKTDFLIIGTRRQLEKTYIESTIIGDTVIKPLKSVRNPVFLFDARMEMNVQIRKICSKAFRGLYNISQIRIHKDTNPCLCIFAP